MLKWYLPAAIENRPRQIAVPFHECHSLAGCSQKYNLIDYRAMSALGQKQTYAMQYAMSALPPIATAKADFRTRSCLLYPRKRTCAVQKGMSALPPKADIHVGYEYTP